MKVSLRCGHCGGSGRKEAPKLTETLALLSRQRLYWLSTQRVAGMLGIGETNAANRLAELHKLGLVERRGNKPLEWRIKP